MKNKNFFLAIVLIVMTIASCTKIESTFNNGVPTNPKGEYAILFGNRSVSTKATITSASQTGYDEFSLFSWNAINDTIMKPYTVQTNGANSYQYDEVSGQELQYFKKTADWYDFIGVIPTTHTMTLKDGAVKVDGLTSFVVDDKRAETAVNLTDSLYWSASLAADSPEEFLWAQKRVEKAEYANAVNLPFNHGNALIFLGFSSDRNDTKLLDYTPHVDAQPAQPAVPGTETYTKKTTKFIDELAAGNEVQVAIGFYGVNSPKLTENNPNPLYVGANNTTNGWLSKDWLLSIKDAVNSQFVYYRLNSVVNSTSKTETTEDWESAASNKNIFMMKLADGVDKAAFAAGNDAFWNALVAHDEGTTEPWVGGSPAMSFKQMFAQAYADGWRVVRINVSDANANQVLVFLSSNIEATTQICEITGGSPAVPAVPESGFKGIRVFSADETPDYCTHIAHTTVADATVSSTGCILSNRATSNEVIQFSLPVATTIGTTAVWSPTTFYALPGDADFDFIVVKLSYTYNGVTVYDVRVPIELPVGGLQAGKYYKYELHITSTGNGTNDPDEANNESEEITIENNPVISVKIAETGYIQGDEKTITI